MSCKKNQKKTKNRKKGAHGGIRTSNKIVTLNFQLRGTPMLDPVSCPHMYLYFSFPGHTCTIHDIMYATTHTYTHTLSLTHSRSHTHTRTRTHTHTHTHTSYTHTLHTHTHSCSWRNPCPALVKSSSSAKPCRSAPLANSSYATPRRRPRGAHTPGRT